MPTVEQRAEALLKRIKKAELDLGRTKHAHAWTSDPNLKRIKPQDHAAHIEKLKKTVADLHEKYRKLDEEHGRNSGGTRRRRRGTRSTRSTRALTARRR
jgi:L-lactate utilization protein LutC